MSVQRVVGEREPHHRGSTLDDFMRRIGPTFARAEPRATARHYIDALIQMSGRRTASQIAEYAGAGGADSVQRLLGSAQWDCDAVRDEMIASIARCLAPSDGVLTVRPRCFPKKGRSSVGVERHFCPRWGRVENSQVGFFTVFETERGGRLIDRELYLPRSWADDPARRRRAHIPASVGFRSAGELAVGMVERGLLGPLRVEWVTSGPFLSMDGSLQQRLDRRRTNYVLELVPDRLEQMLSKLRHVSDRRLTVERANVASGARSAGGSPTEPSSPGAWTRIDLPTPELAGTVRCLLVREQAGERRGFLCRAPAPTTIGGLADVAGSIERADECLATACDLAGLDTYECRQWSGWYRHVTLAAAALHCLAQDDTPTEAPPLLSCR